MMPARVSPDPEVARPTLPWSDDQARPCGVAMKEQPPFITTTA